MKAAETSWRGTSLHGVCSPCRGSFSRNSALKAWRRLRAPLGRSNAVIGQGQVCGGEIQGLGQGFFRNGGQAGGARKQTREHGAGDVLEAPCRGGLDEGVGVDIDGGGDGGEIAFVGVGGVAEDVDAGWEG